MQSKTDKSSVMEPDVEIIRKEAKIAQVSVATVKGNDSPISHDYGDVAVNQETIFGAASLSKPVFTYLVLKLVEAGKLTLDMKGLNNILPFQTFCEQHGFKWKNDEEINEDDIARINAFTPEMILSHTTGFDLSRTTDQVNHQFEPGQEYYRYSGLPLFYLQKVIEKLNEPQLAFMPDNDSFEENKLYVSINPPNLKYTIFDLTGIGVSGTIDLKTLNCDLLELTDINDLNPYLPQIIEEVTKRGHTPNLDVLAKKYVFEPLHMNHSSFGENPCAANSLNTTAENYARFVQAWMSDEKLQYAFKPQIIMTQDPWAQAVVPNKKALEYVAECLGFQLEIDKNGKPLSAFKTGDMGPWRGWVTIDLNEDIKQRKATVYFAKGPEPDGNGHMLAETLMAEYQLEHGLYWFREKYGFSTGLEENWESAQKMRCTRGMGYQDESPRLAIDSTQKDSTQKMLHLMSSGPEPVSQTNDSPKEQKNLNNTPSKDVREKKDNEEQEGPKFNPTPLVLV